MVANDVKETERIDAKNALEEYVYDMRNKLQVKQNKQKQKNYKFWNWNCK